MPKTAVIYRLPNCPSGQKAVQLLQARQIPYQEVILATPEQVTAFKAQYQVNTTPQVFIDDQRIGGYESLRKYFQLQQEYSYTPVGAVFATAGLMALATSMGITGFMGYSLAMLASLKLMDINSFVESFAKYDLITQRWRVYGRLYPFLELAIALGLLSGLGSVAVGWSSLLMGSIGSGSVIQAVWIDQKSLTCACVGGNTKAPLGVISLTENLAMAIMGLVMVLTPMMTPVPAVKSPTELESFTFTRQLTGSSVSLSREHPSWVTLKKINKTYAKNI
ncbi:MAG: glutaredoxin family protein [Pseudanabaenaceae cyanobacterium]